MLVGCLWSFVLVLALVCCCGAILLFCVAALATNSGRFTVVRLALRVCDVPIGRHCRLCVPDHQCWTFLLCRVGLRLRKDSSLIDVSGPGRLRWHKRKETAETDVVRAPAEEGARILLSDMKKHLQRPASLEVARLITRLNRNQHKLACALTFGSRRDLLQTIHATCLLLSFVSLPVRACSLGFG